MEFSKLKLEIYDLLGTLVPGILFVVLCLLTVSGSAAGLMWLYQVTATQLTLLLFAAFAAGQLVQEAADQLICATRGPRYLKRARDVFWRSPEAQAVRDKIKSELSVDLGSADAAHDYCLTIVGDKFLKRDTFMAISDLARSLWLLACASVIPLLRFTNNLGWSWHARAIAAGFFAIGVISYLAWVRMVRFRQLSDVTVFTIFLAVKSSASVVPTNKQSDVESD